MNTHPSAPLCLWQCLGFPFTNVNINININLGLKLDSPSQKRQVTKASEKESGRQESDKNDKSLSL